MQSKSNTKNNRLSGGVIFVSALTGIAVTALLLFLAAALIESGRLKEQNIKLAIIIINVVAGFICGLAARAAAGEGGSINGILSGAVYATIMLLLGILLDLGSADSAQIIRQYAVSIVSSFIGSKVNLVKSNKKLRKKRKV